MCIRDRLVAACGEPEYGGDESGRVAVADLKRFLRYDVIAVGRFRMSRFVDVYKRQI